MFARIKRNAAWFIGMNLFYCALRYGLYCNSIYDLYDDRSHKHVAISNYNFWLFNMMSYWIDDPAVCYGPFRNYSLCPIIINHYNNEHKLIKTYDESELLPLWLLPFF